MNQKISENDLEAALEALLFVSAKPVSALRLSEILQVDITATNNALDSLSKSLSEQNRGIQLREVAGGWRLYSHPAFHELLEEYAITWDTSKLSPAMMETLAIVAYSQPCTRAYVAATRGVTSESSITSLVSKGLLREAGVSDAPGNPALYATTPDFLEKFGLRSVDDLPPLEDFVPDASTKELIRERLSAHRMSQDEMGERADQGADLHAYEGQAENAESPASSSDSANSAGRKVENAEHAAPESANSESEAPEAENHECANHATPEAEEPHHPFDEFSFEIEDDDEIIEGVQDYV